MSSSTWSRGCMVGDPSPATEGEICGYTSPPIDNCLSRLAVRDSRLVVLGWVSAVSLFAAHGEDTILDSPWLIGAVSVLAGAIAAVSGFGIGSLLTPILMLSMPPAHAV